MVTPQGLLVSSLRTDALAKLLIEKSLITQEEFMRSRKTRHVSKTFFNESERLVHG